MQASGFFLTALVKNADRQLFRLIPKWNKANFTCILEGSVFYGTFIIGALSDLNQFSTSVAIPEAGG